MIFITFIVDTVSTHMSQQKPIPCKATGLVPHGHNVTITLTYLVFHWLIGCYNIEWTSLNSRWLGLGGQRMKILRRLAWKFDVDRSERKSSQVNARARKSSWRNWVASCFWQGLNTSVNLGSDNAAFVGLACCQLAIKMLDQLKAPHAFFFIQIGKSDVAFR